MHRGELRKWSADYSGAGTAVTLAPKPFLIFTATLCFSIMQPFTLNTLQYLADRDVGKITWF
jgi:hypothetical protein